MSDNRLLVMDDDPDVGEFYAQVGSDLGYEVLKLTDPLEFDAAVRRFRPTVIMLDLQMPGRDGIELLRDLSVVEDQQPKVLIASGLDSRVLTTASELGLSMGVHVEGAFCKPVALHDLELQLARLKSQERVITEKVLRAGLENGEFVVHYLPKASFKGAGRWLIEGAEALVRWDHPHYGLLYPREFIGVAEQCGLIVELTDFVLRSAMEQVRLWRANGLLLDLGVNLSVQFLGDLEFPDRLLKMIREHGLDPTMLTLELTETAALRDPAVTMDILARLRVKNINLCLDDFGKGASSLTHLYRMPFSEVKLHNQFMDDMRVREDARAMVEGLIYLAHKLEMRACAEGVEDQATLRLLEAMRCDKVQGHHIGPAVRAKDFPELMANWNSRFQNEFRDRAVV